MQILWEIRFRAGRKALKCVYFGRGGIFFSEKWPFLALFQISFGDLKKSKRDIDEFDNYFDHILVVDHSKSGKIYDKVVGTYRLNGGNYKDKKSCLPDYKQFRDSET